MATGAVARVLHYARSGARDAGSGSHDLLRRRQVVADNGPTPCRGNDDE